LFELLLELLQACPGHGRCADFPVGDEDGKLLAEEHGVSGRRRCPDVRERTRRVF
jgi:hypothetical protein